MLEIAFGTCDGTGAAINIILGWQPDMVKMWNTQHANEKSIEWFRLMQPFTSMDEGVKLDNSTITPVTANGITVYAGGDEITYDGVTNNRWEDAAGNSVEEVYVDGYFKKTADAAPLYRCYGDRVIPNLIDGAKIKTTEGFTIGTDGININDEQLCWMAIRSIENE